MAKYFSYQISLCLFIFSALDFSCALKSGECEVCVKIVNQLIDSLTTTQRGSVHEIEAKFMDFCARSKKVENRFCYYIGGLEESATKIVSEMSKPISWGLPADKVCEKLKKKDAQVCDLRYEVVIDLKSVDLKKLKVKDLKKILSDWDERCDGCIEKPDFIKRIEELKPHYIKEEL